MTSQSTLGDDPGIAEELAEGQRSISIAEFFEKNKHMLGFDSPARGLVTAVKEGVDNALDATEEAGILPDIYVEIEDVGDYYRLVIEDNGPGITKAELPKVFGKLLYGSRFHKREQSLLPDQQVLIKQGGSIDLVAIETLCNAYIPRRSGQATVEVNDDIEVPCFDRDTGQINWQSVSHAIRHETDHDTYHIETAGGRTIAVTGNHSLFALDNAGDLIEVAAEDLSSGDAVLAPASIPTPGDHTAINLLEYLPRSVVSDRDWRVEGVPEDLLETLRDRGTRVDPDNQSDSHAPIYRIDGIDIPSRDLERGTLSVVDAIDLGICEELTDTSIRTPRANARIPTQISFDNTVGRQLGRYLRAHTAGASQSDVDESMSELVGALERPTPEANSGSGLQTIARQPLATILKDAFGITDGELTIPGFLFRAPDAVQSAFLDGLAGDSPLITNHERFARDVVYLWSMQGITAELHPCDDGSYVVDSDCSVGTPVDSISQTGPFVDGDLELLEITEINSVPAPDYVYDLSVPGTGADENFVAGNHGPLAVRNSRGQQGIGISAAVLYAQLTSGKPAKITSRPKGEDTAEYFELVIDTDTNDPEIRTEETTSWDRPHGTRIELEMEANMRARQQLHEYIRNTAVVNPHARIELREPGLDKPMKFERGTDQLPAETEEIRPHPHGVELGTLLKMIDQTDSRSVSGFLKREFTRVGGKTAESIIDAFRDRYYGRELTWSVPGPHEGVDIEAIVIDATANKGADATAAFASAVAERLSDRERVAHHELSTIVAAAGEETADSFAVTFGSTVRENVIDALWAALTGSSNEDSRRRADCYRIINEATSTRKDDATIDGLARRIAEKIATETGQADRLTAAQLRDFVDRAAEMTVSHQDTTVGETARENIYTALWGQTVTVPDDPPQIRDLRGDRDAVSDLLEAMRETNVLSPPTSCLAPITEELIEAGLRKEFDADFYAAATRDAEVHGGDPFIVEAGIAYGGEIESGSANILRFANRVPLVYQRGACATTDVVKSIGWRNYKLDQPGGSGIPNGPAVLMIHVASTNVPFTSESKDAIANVPEIEDEIELAIREAARELKSYLKKKRSMQQRQKKQDALADILPEMAEKVADVTGKEVPNYDDALAKIMNNVLVERHVSTEDGTAQVALTVENHTSSGETFEITEIVSEEPTVLPEEATAVEVDGEWFIKWSVNVPAGESEQLTYRTDTNASFDLSIDGVETAKLTLNG